MARDEVLVLLFGSDWARRSDVGAAAGAPPDREALVVELDHLDEVLVPDAAVGDRERIAVFPRSARRTEEIVGESAAYLTVTTSAPSIA